MAMSNHKASFTLQVLIFSHWPQQTSVYRRIVFPPPCVNKVAAVSQFSTPCKVPLLPWHKRCPLPPCLVPLLLQGVDDYIVDGDAGEVDKDGHGSAEGAGGAGLASNPGFIR